MLPAMHATSAAGVNSLTQTDSFAMRAQRSETQRTRLVLSIFIVLLSLVLIRELFTGGVGWDHATLRAGVVLFMFGAAYEALFLWRVSAANREARLLADWRWRVNAAVELAIPVAILIIFNLLSPPESGLSLSPPAILIVPAMVMLSVLRLRPRFTLSIGMIAAGAHLALVIRTIVVHPELAPMKPVLVTYSVGLGVTAAAAWLVARAVRRYVVESVEETAAAERSRRRVEAMEQELSIARDIQRGLLPEASPDAPGFNIAGFSRPADLTGGDFYDWQGLPDGRTAIVLADVTGHGIGPALVMAVCRAYARASLPIVSTPEELLAQLNVLVHDDVRGRRFITLALAIIDSAASRIDLLSAGHGPTLLFRAATGSVDSFGGDGMPLGILRDERFGSPRELAMEPGDVLLLMTDGFFEAQRPGDGQSFGIERIGEMLRSHPDLDAAGLIARLDAEVRAFTAGSPQIDDMTAVAIRCG